MLTSTTIKKGTNYTRQKVGELEFVNQNPNLLELQDLRMWMSSNEAMRNDSFDLQMWNLKLEVIDT